MSFCVLCSIKFGVVTEPISIHLTDIDIKLNSNKYSQHNYTVKRKIYFRTLTCLMTYANTNNW